MLRHSRSTAAGTPERLRNAFRAAVFVLVCTGVSIAHIGCGGEPEPEATGPIVLEDLGIGLVDLPQGCAQAEASDGPFELVCELIETTETPAGPAGTVRFELGETSDFGIELADVSALDVLREEQTPLFEALPGGEFLGVGGALFYGPFGPARYSRGRFQAGDGTTLQRIRFFMVHPTQNRLVTLVYDHPPVDRADSAARINNHLLVLLENLRSSDDLQAAAAEGEAQTE